MTNLRVFVHVCLFFVAPLPARRDLDLLRDDSVLNTDVVENFSEVAEERELGAEEQTLMPTDELVTMTAFNHGNATIHDAWAEQGEPQKERDESDAQALLIRSPVPAGASSEHSKKMTQNTPLMLPSTHARLFEAEVENKLLAEEKAKIKKEEDDGKNYLVSFVEHEEGDNSNMNNSHMDIRGSKRQQDRVEEALARPETSATSSFLNTPSSEKIWKYGGQNGDENGPFSIDEMENKIKELNCGDVFQQFDKLTYHDLGSHTWIGPFTLVQFLDCMNKDMQCCTKAQEFFFDRADPLQNLQKAKQAAERFASQAQPRYQNYLEIHFKFDPSFWELFSTIPSKNFDPEEGGRLTLPDLIKYHIVKRPVGRGGRRKSGKRTGSKKGRGGARLSAEEPPPIVIQEKWKGFNFKCVVPIADAKDPIYKAAKAVEESVTCTKEKRQAVKCTDEADGDQMEIKNLLEPALKAKGEDGKAVDEDERVFRILRTKGYTKENGFKKWPLARQGFKGTGKSGLQRLLMELKNASGSLDPDTTFGQWQVPAMQDRSMYLQTAMSNFGPSSSSFYKVPFRFPNILDCWDRLDAMPDKYSTDVLQAVKQSLLKTPFERNFAIYFSKERDDEALPIWTPKKQKQARAFAKNMKLSDLPGLPDGQPLQKVLVLKASKGYPGRWQCGKDKGWPQKVPYSWLAVKAKYKAAGITTLDSPYKAMNGRCREESMNKFDWETHDASMLKFQEVAQAAANIGQQLVKQVVI